MSNGIIEESKTPKKLKFESFKFNLYIILISQIKLKKSNVLLHCAFVDLHFYYYINNKQPELND